MFGTQYNSALYLSAGFSSVMIKLFIFVHSLPELFSGLQAPGQGCLPYLVLYSQYFCVPGTYELSVQYWWLSEWPLILRNPKTQRRKQLSMSCNFKGNKNMNSNFKNQIKKIPPKKIQIKGMNSDFKNQIKPKNPPDKKHLNTVITTGDPKWWDCSAKERWPLIWERLLESCRRLRRWEKEGTNHWREKKQFD